jgi:hypothetical protein
MENDDNVEKKNDRYPSTARVDILTLLTSSQPTARTHFSVTPAAKSLTKKLKLSNAAHFSSLSSTLGGGLHGYLGLVVTPANKLRQDPTQPNHVFTRPAPQHLGALNITTTKKKEKTEQQQIQDLRNNGDTILADLDNAPIFQYLTCKEFPSFDHAEIDYGPMLGQGGFSDVFEVSNILLKWPGDANDAVAAEASSPISTNDTVVVVGEKESGKEDEEAAAEEEEEAHYDLRTARSHMSKRCIRFGSARYAVKRIRADLSALNRARHDWFSDWNSFFRVICHPNIVKMRAISNTPRLSADTFLIMDR